MTDVDFLNELATAEQSGGTASDSNVPNTQVANGTAKTSDNEANANDSTDSAADSANGSTAGQKYSNVVETRPEDADVSDLYTVSDFASKLTVRNITEKGMGADGIVKDSNVYAAMRAVRHPLPVVLVGEPANPTAYLPEAAVAAWDSRPARGEGAATGSGGRLSDDELFRLSAQVRDKRDALQKRLASLQNRIAQAENLFNKRDRQLSERFADSGWDKVDEWVSANTEEIPDDEKNDES